MHQVSFDEAEYRNKRRKPRREKFLEQMDSLVPWHYIKRVFGYDKVRYRELAKNTDRLCLLAGFRQENEGHCMKKPEI